MFRSVVVALLVLSSSVHAQSFPSSTVGTASTAKPARVSLTVDGPWLPTPMPAKTHVTVYDDSTPRPRFDNFVDGARLLLYVERDALQTVALADAFVQPTEAVKPGTDRYRSPGFVPHQGMAVEVLGPEQSGLVKVRIANERLEVTGYMTASTIGTTYRYVDSARAPTFTPDKVVPKNFALLDSPKGTAFVIVHASEPQDVMVLQRSGGFALVRTADDGIGWIDAKQVRKRPRQNDLYGEEGGEEGGVAGGVVGGVGSSLTLPAGTPLFDRIDGAFVGVALFFTATAVETKGEWKRYTLQSPFGDISVWASKNRGREPAPLNVAPTMLEVNRIAGDKAIVPEDSTKTEIMKAKKDKLVGSFKLCLDSAGAITEVRMLKSTGFTAYDAKIMRGMRGWKYKPWIVDGKAAPVCTAVTFIYSQK